MFYCRIKFTNSIMSHEDNIDEDRMRQQEEIEVLCSIYDQKISLGVSLISIMNNLVIGQCLDSETSITISCSESGGEGSDVKLSISFSPGYPTSSPPTYTLSAPFLTTADKQDLSLQLDQLYLDNMGEPVVFHWVEHLRSFLQQRQETLDNERDDDETVSDDVIAEEMLLSEALERSKLDQVADIVTGDVIEDRKSVFQAHTAVVRSLEEVKSVVAKLYQNQKIARATHNIYAFRIFCSDKKTWLSDCEDDGEDAAGGRLLHLLEILDIVDRVVVVSRWYGGVHLGPDRFKHINNAARMVLNTADPDLIQHCDNKLKKKKGK